MSLPCWSTSPATRMYYQNWSKMKSSWTRCCHTSLYVPSPLYLILGIPRASHDMSFQQPEEPNADVQAMLLANISKDDSFLSVIDSTQKAPAELSPSERVIDQLMDLFVKGQDGSYNKKANFDYLAYV